MVARHHQRRCVNGVDERARLLELTVARALRQIAGNRHQIGVQPVYAFQKWGHQLGTVAAKVQV